MSVRELINRRPMVTSIIAGACIVLLLGWTLWNATGTKPAPTASRFYTADDGKTWFPDSLDLLPPFDHQGRIAVIAHVVSDGQREFVALLEKYSDEARDKLKGLPADESRFDLLDKLGGGAILIKKPGDDKWLASNSPEAIALRQSVFSGERKLKVVIP